jgi:hypothetical protein
MYAERELSFEAIRAHSRDSSAHARHSAAVIIFISTSELNPTKAAETVRRTEAQPRRDSQASFL